MRGAAKTWHLLPHDRGAIERLGREARVSPVVAQLLLNRGVADPDAAQRFLGAPFKSLREPELLPGVPEAAERLHKAIAQGRRICVYGDYDVDGLTGTALLWEGLRLLGAVADYYVPHRIDEGYGLNAEALHRIAQSGAAVVVTVDCGIGSTAEAETARRLGLELIITDHHEPKEQLPAADVLVHPRLPGTSYSFGDLSGSGVAFKLAWALCQKASGATRVTPRFREYLLESVTLAALGMIADVVPLHDENRIFVRHGLARLREVLTLEFAPVPRRVSWRPGLGAAAAILLVVFLLGRTGSRIGGSAPLESREARGGEGPRLLASVEGTEILAAAGSHLSRSGPGGGEGPWLLSRGSCLAFAPKGEVSVKAGAILANVREGEILVRVGNPVQGSAPAEVVVLSGSALLLASGHPLELASGEGFRIDASGGQERRACEAQELSDLRASVCSCERQARKGRGVGRIRQDGSSWVLEGGRDPAAWLLEAPEEPYHALLRVRGSGGPYALGLSYTVGGRPSVWMLDAPALGDGDWHLLGVVVSAGWVTLTLDGEVRHRIARSDFKPNAMAGVSGVGPVSWGGRVEVSAKGSSLQGLW